MSRYPNPDTESVAFLLTPDILRKNFIGFYFGTDWAKNTGKSRSVRDASRRTLSFPYELVCLIKRSIFGRKKPS